MSVVVPFQRRSDVPPPPLRLAPPPLSGPARADPATPRLAMHYRDITLAEVVRELGFQHHATRTAIVKLRALAQHSSMPLPRNPRVSGGVPVTGPGNICARSIWDRGEFLAWRDWFRSGGAALNGEPPALPVHQQTQLRDRLRMRAGSAA